MKLIGTAVLVALSVLGCKSSEGGGESATGDKGALSPTASASALGSAASSAAEAPPAPPAVAAVRAGKLLHPATGAELKLVETALAKCFGFKGYSMMLPEGATLETVAGARACAAFLPSSNKKFGLMVMTDEIKVKMWKRTDLENVKAKPLDEPDAFVFEVEEKGKRKLTGWLEKKIGAHTVQCNSMRDDDTMSLEQELAFIELCRTLKFAEPDKK